MVEAAVATHRQDQHDERRGLAVAAPPGGDKECRPLIEERAFDQGERGGNDRRLAGVVGGHVDQPLVAQELHRRLHSFRGAVLALRDDRPQLLRDGELDATQTIEPVRRQQLPARQDNGRRRNRNHCRQRAVISPHEVPHKLSREMHRARYTGLLVLFVEIDVPLDHLGDFHLAHFAEHPLFGRWQTSHLYSPLVRRSPPTS
jgi:hypothetical protein